jgi:hypothetical protein
LYLLPNSFSEKIDTLGKSPAYGHRRKNSKACTGQPVAGFLHRAPGKAFEPIASS